MTTVRVTVTFQMDIDAGPYGEDCTVGQMRRQATAEAREAASRIISVSEKMRLRLTDVGVPVVVLDKLA